MKKNSVNSLLVKNGFRVFWKTKTLAIQLTILTTLAATGLTATILTNYNLDNSKKAVLTKGNAFDFTISTSQNNITPVKLTTLSDSESKLFSVPYQNHLIANDVNHNFTTKKFSWNQQIYNSKTGDEIWTNSGISYNNQKLIYYFATTPEQSGINLFRMKNYDENVFSSLIEIPNNIKNEVLGKTSEIFSFSVGNNQENLGIPEVINNELGGVQSFKLNNILLDQTNIPIGVPAFGQIQATGFEPKNNVPINHNVVNTNSINQNDFVCFKNKKNNYGVPNNFNVYFGDQSKFIDQYIHQIESIYSYIGLDQKSKNSNVEILLGVGDSFNQISQNSNNVNKTTKWTPVLVSLDQNLLKGTDLFCYQMLLGQAKQDKIFDYFYTLMTKYEKTLPTKRLNESDINLQNLVELQKQYSFLKHLQTIFWVPSYLSRDEAKNEIQNASNQWYLQSHQYFENLVSSNYACNNWEQEFKKVLTNAINIYNNCPTLDPNQLFSMLINYLKIEQFYSFKSDYFINKLNKNKNAWIEKFNLVNNQLQSWKTFVADNLYSALQQFVSPAFYNYSWYTTKGLLDTFGFVYRVSNDFTTQPDNNGIAYTYSEINKDAKVNNVVSNDFINWDYFENSLEIDNSQFINLINDFNEIEGKINSTNQYPITNYGYDWYLKNKPYIVFNIMSKSIVYDGTSNQVTDIIKVTNELANLNENEIKNESDFLTKWPQAFIKATKCFNIKSVSVQNEIIVLTLGYLIGFGPGGSIPIQGTVLDKSAFVSLVAESYLNANKYSTSNPGGKEPYPYFDSYNKAKQLPFFNPFNRRGESSNFDPTSPNWIYNHETDSYDYFPDFFSWLYSLPDKYKLTINNQNILIVGNAISPEFLYPTQNENNLLINPKLSPILYTNKFGYNYALNSNSNVSTSSYYAIKKVHFNERNYFYKEVLGLINPVKKLNKILSNNITNTKNGLAYSVDNPNQPNRLLYTRANFTNIVQHGLLTASIVLSLILLLLSGVFACTLIRSIVKQSKKTFGIAMSNGIQKRKLTTMMLPFALIPGIFAGVFGYLFATLLQPLILNSISSYWNLPVVYNYYVWWLFILIPIFIVGVLFLIIYLVVLWTLRKNVTELLSSSVSFRMNSLIENSKWLTKKMRPTNAFKVTYMLGNITRFLTLVCVITTFITLTSTSIGALNTFTTSLSYTQKNKNYTYGLDLVSPTIQGGWYYAIPYSQIGTTQQGITNTVQKQNEVDYQYQSIGKINNQDLQAKTTIVSSQATLQLWLQINLPNYSFGTTSDINISSSILNNFIDNSKLNLTSLSGSLQTFSNSNLMVLTPKTVIKNGSSSQITVDQPKSMYINYINESSTYSPKDFDAVWTNPYDPSLQYTSSYYPSFKLSQQFLGDLQFFKNNLFIQLGLDIDFNLGAFQLNPWSISKTLLPKMVIANSIQNNNTTIQRLIDFYSYLDRVAINQIKPIDPILTYENYYGEMKTNKPTRLSQYNPLNLNGNPFKFDSHNKPILDPNNSLVSLQKEVGVSDNYVLNENVAVQKLPNIQLKPETIRLFVYMMTNSNNKVYQMWLKKVAKVDVETKGYDSTYKLAPNIVALSDRWDSHNYLENTYTYITGNITKNNHVILNNGKIIGLNNLNDIQKSSVILYDINNNPLNHLLINKVDNHTFPLIINEVVAKANKLKIGDAISINPNNDLFRYVDKANNTINQSYYNFKVVGITTSKSEQQMYTNQIFANEILGYNSDRLGAKQSYASIVDSNNKPYVPFNGFYTNNPLSPMINNFASMYSVSGLTPINAVLKRGESGGVIYNDAAITIDINKIKLNDIVKFNLVQGNSYIYDIVNRLINIFGDGQVLNCLDASINSADVTFTTSLVGQTIDNTLTNIQGILAAALLPTLLIIICLMATMIVSESRRLIAIMKVLGIGDWKNTFNFLFIYFIVLLLGLVIAIPLTYGILSLLSNLTFSFFNIIINPVAPWWIYLASIGGLGLIFSLMFYVVKNKMSKINLPQAISFES